MLCIYLYGMEEGIQADIDGGRDRNKRADRKDGEHVRRLLLHGRMTAEEQGSRLCRPGAEGDKGIRRLQSAAKPPFEKGDIVPAAELIANPVICTDKRKAEFPMQAFAFFIGGCDQRIQAADILHFEQCDQRRIQPASNPHTVELRIQINRQFRVPLICRAGKKPMRICISRRQAVYFTYQIRIFF